MAQNETEYLERRAEEERSAAAANEGIIRQTHEKFAAAYAERIAQANIAPMPVVEVLA